MAQTRRELLQRLGLGAGIVAGEVTGIGPLSRLLSSGEASAQEAPRGLQEVIVNTSPRQEKEHKVRPFTSADLHKSQGHAVNELVDGNLVIYYTTNSERLFWNDLEDVERYLGSLQPGTPIVIEGYADHRGEVMDNLDLSRRRAEGIRLTTPDRIKRNHPMEISAYGESKATETGHSGKDLYKDRKVRIVIGRSDISRGLDQIAADYYLLDCSGSMGPGERLSDGTSKWEAVQQHHFSPGSKAYVFGHCADRKRPISQVEANGETPLYQGGDALVEIASIGETVGILSDGEDPEMTANYQRLIDFSLHKGVKIGVLGIGLQGQNKSIMQTVADKTGGKFYFIE